MRKVTCFHLQNCPYCKQAKKVLADLIAENPAYKEVTIEWIEEREEPDIAAKYDYYYVPSMFIGQEKLYEARPLESYDACRANVKTVLDAAMAQDGEIYEH